MIRKAGNVVLCPEPEGSMCGAGKSSLGHLLGDSSPCLLESPENLIKTRMTDSQSSLESASVPSQTLNFP